MTRESQFPRTLSLSAETTIDLAEIAVGRSSEDRTKAVLSELPHELTPDELDSITIQAITLIDRVTPSPLLADMRFQSMSGNLTLAIGRYALLERNDTVTAETCIESLKGQGFIRPLIFARILKGAKASRREFMQAFQNTD